MKRIVILILVITGSAGAVVMFNANVNRPTEYHFDRIAPFETLAPHKIWDLNERSIYIAGKHFDSLYLGNNLRPSELKMINLKIKGNAAIHPVSLKGTMPKATSFIVQSGKLYMMDLVSYKMYKASLEHPELKQFMDHRNFFSEAIPVSENTVITRTLAQGALEYVLAVETAGDSSIRRVNGLLEKQIDGLFCTDGMLTFNPATQHLLYVYFYRNQFICMDTTLTLIYRRNTIDPVETARIKVARVEKDNTITLASPPYIVNKRAATDGHWLFINSEIKSRKEDPDLFRRTSAIDVYNLADGSYRFTFYVPAYKGHKLREFKVFNSSLVAIQGRHLVTYNMPVIN